MRGLASRGCARVNVGGWTDGILRSSTGRRNCSSDKPSKIPRSMIALLIEVALAQQQVSLGLVAHMPIIPFPHNPSWSWDHIGTTRSASGWTIRTSPHPVQQPRTRADQVERLDTHCRVSVIAHHGA